MKYALLMISVFLAGCATQPCTPVCLPLKQWSDVQQMNAKADLDTLPTDSVLIGMLVDYSRIRAQIRACDGG